MVKLVYTRDLKSLDLWSCRFESDSGHHFNLRKIIHLLLLVGIMFYHYSKKKFSELLTRSLQGVVTEEERKDADEAGTFRGDIGPYYDSISFLLEPAPLDIISSLFPKDHHTWKEGNSLIEHIVDLKGQDFYGWDIVEGPIAMLFVDNLPWIDNVFYKKVYFKTRSLGKKLFNEQGNDFKSLEKALKKFPEGTTREAYLKIKDRSDYDTIKNMYAATVPHLMIYTKTPINIKHTNKVSVGIPSKGLENHPPSSIW